MAKRVIMPALGMAQETGIIIRWLKQEGEAVTEGEPLLEIETDKTTAELEAEASGVLAGISARAGDEVPVAETIAWILAPGEALPADAGSPAAAPSPAAPAPAAPTTPGAPPTGLSASPVAARMAREHGIDLSQVPAAGSRIGKEDVQAYLAAQAAAPPAGNGAAAPRLAPASPLARRLAGEQGYRLADIPGSGPDGAVLAADVRGYQPAPAAPTPTPPAAPGISQAWRVMAARLSESWQTVPHFYLTREVEATALLNWRAAAQKRTATKITYTDLLLRAVAAALREHPRVNASWIDGDIRPNEDIHVGLAVATDDGLLVPVIPHTDRLTVAALAAARQGVVERALAGRLKLSDLQGGTFTISNLGMYGIDAFHAVVNPPQAAILAVGRIADRVVPAAGVAAIRPMMLLTLSLDHRVVDGARGARFLATLVTTLEDPLGIL